MGDDHGPCRRRIGAIGALAAGEGEHECKVLTPTLGDQFEAEGAHVVSVTYDPKANGAKDIVRVRRLAVRPCDD